MGSESEHCALQILSEAGILCLVLLYFILFGFHSCLEEGKSWYSDSNEIWPQLQGNGEITKLLKADKISLKA